MGPRVAKYDKVFYELQVERHIFTSDADDYDPAQRKNVVVKYIL